jgi:hypothetical protein
MQYFWNKKIDGKCVFRAVGYGLAFDIHSLLQKTAHESRRMEDAGYTECGRERGWQKDGESKMTESGRC